MFIDIPINPTSISIAVIGLFALIALILSSIALAKVDNEDRWGTKAVQLAADDGCTGITEFNIKRNDGGAIGGFAFNQKKACFIIVGKQESIVFQLGERYFQWSSTDELLSWLILGNLVDKYKGITAVFSNDGKTVTFSWPSNNTTGTQELLC